MQTLKTALVVTFLLAVLYGVFVTLNQPEPSIESDGFETVNEPTIELPSFDSGPDALGEPGAPPHFGPPADYPLPDLPGSVGAAPTPSADFERPLANEVTVPSEASAAFAVETPEPEPSGSIYSPDGPGDDHFAGTSGPGEFNQSPYGNAGANSNTINNNVPAYVPGDSTPTDYVPQDIVPSEISPNDIAPNSNVAGAPAGDDTETLIKLAQYNFRNAWADAQDQLDGNDYGAALGILTEVYREKYLPPEQRTQLLEMLDKLAGSVIYSTEHRLEAPYTVARGETLEQIAQARSVPSELLFNINRGMISEPDLLLPGTQLKVMRGPFRAEIEIDADDPSRGEATLFLHKLYAGRFPVTFGSDLPAPGRTYQVTERLQGKSFYPPSGQPLQAGSPGNPYGSYWIGLNDPAVGLHGGEASDPRGSIRLSNRDAADVFGILSVGSVVEVLQGE